MAKDERRYEILDGHTGAVVGKAKGLRSALRCAERRNQEYGAHRYNHRRIPDAPPATVSTYVVLPDGSGLSSDEAARIAGGRS